MLTRFVTQRSSLVAPVSGELRDIMLELGIPSAKCQLPRFGVDVEMFHPPASSRPARDRVRVLFVGSLIERKGLQDLLDALSDPGFGNVHLLVVGDGPNAAELKLKCERLGLASRTEWKGLLAPEEVARLMRDVDLLCLPSYMEADPMW